MHIKYEEKELPKREPTLQLALPNGNKLCFWDEEHIYSVNGNYVICFSDVIVASGIGTDVGESNIDKDYLTKCAEYGTKVHKCIELFVKSGKKPLISTPYFRFFVEEIYDLCDEWNAETPVFDGKICSTVDLWGAKKDGTGYIIVDHKTGVVFYDKVEWQTSINERGLKYSGYIPSDAKVSKFVFSVKNTYEECEFVPLKDKTQLELRHLDIALENKCDYIPPYNLIDANSIIPSNYLGESGDFLKHYIWYKQNKPRLDEFEDMLKNLVNSKEEDSALIDTPVGFYMYSKGTRTTTVVDMDEIRKKCPKFMAEYDKKCKKYTKTNVTPTVAFKKKRLAETDLLPFVK